MSIFEKQPLCGCEKPDCYFCWLKDRAYTTTMPIIVNQPNEAGLNDILKNVSTASGVAIKQITGRSRMEKVRIARQMFCYIARKKERFPGEPMWTLKQIGEAVSYRQHCTVIHSIETVATMLHQKNVSEYKSLGYRLGLI